MPACSDIGPLSLRLYADAGLLLDYGHLSLMAGLSTISFQTLGFEVGLGLLFLPFSDSFAPGFLLPLVHEYISFCGASSFSLTRHRSLSLFLTHRLPSVFASSAFTQPFQSASFFSLRSQLSPPVIPCRYILLNFCVEIV